MVLPQWREQLTQPGDDLRDAVANLLRAAQFDVEVEVLVGSKKVDVLFSKRQFGKTSRTAVECKDYGRVLTREEVSRIYHDLASLYDSRKVDEIHIVTRARIAPAAHSYVEETRCLCHYTFAELQESIMDFTPHLRSLRFSVAEEAIENYFVPPLTKSGEDLGHKVENWLQSDKSENPIAILAGYGMGKTTFARFFAANMASKVLEGHRGRIPIYIPLGEISSEQSLEGLLGKIFSARTISRDFNFDLFMALNSAGRLCIFLDGFDEMKHTMTWEQFKFNFSQINRLVTGNCRVLILGRPNAFLSDSEHNWVLRGIRNVGGQTLRLPEWPEYSEIEISPFPPDSAFSFIQNYLAHRPTKSQEKYRTFEEVKREISHIEEAHLREILSRPVHVKMLAEVASYPNVTFRNFTVYQLYDLFIQLTIERELEKQERQSFGAAQRRKFARELAWWLWTKGQAMNVTAGQIPARLIESFKRSPEDELDSIRRDLVSACFLDRKIGGGCTFLTAPFRSFLCPNGLFQPKLVNRISVS